MVKVHNIIVMMEAYKKVVDGVLGKLVFDTVKENLNATTMRIMKLFGIRRLSGEGRYYSLEDNLYGNITLHMINKDKSLTGIVH